MTTNLEHNDDITDIRLEFDIEQGYIIPKECRQGKDGNWVSHDIEVMGRDYNSKEVDNETSTRAGKDTDPTEISVAFEDAEEKGLASDGEVNIDEINSPEAQNDALISTFIEKYQLSEYYATKMVEYMNNECTEEEALEQVKEDMENDFNGGKAQRQNI